MPKVDGNEPQHAEGGDDDVGTNAVTACRGAMGEAYAWLEKLKRRKGVSIVLRPQEESAQCLRIMLLEVEQFGIAVS